MSKPIPPREPVGDLFKGIVLAVGAARLLAAQDVETDRMQIVLSGALIAPEDAALLPRLLQALPRFVRFADWRERKLESGIHS